MRHVVNPEVIMPVLTFPFGPLDANCHLLHNGVDAVIADPSDQTDDVLQAAKALGLTVRALLLTHAHFDHAGGAEAMVKATGLPVFVGLEDWAVRDLYLMGGLLYGFPRVPLFEADILEPGPARWGSLECEVIHAPGHSPGSLCFYFPAEKALLSGDVIFYRSVGRSDLPGGDQAALFQTLRQSIYTLPPDTVIYPGHGDPTTVGDEAAANPFCRA